MGSKIAALVALVALAAAVFASPAQAAEGYELSTSRSLPGSMKGIAIDQTSQDIYIAIVSTNPDTGALGQINRFNSDLSADGTFATGGGYFTGVAVNPLTQAFYAVQEEIRGTPAGNVGTPRLDRFTSAGASDGSFPLAYSDSFPVVATDSEANLYIPNVTTHSVQVFNPSGTLLEEITCSGCPGGTFGKPGSVALNAADDLYVADTDPDRVVKLTSSGGTYAYASTLQSGQGAGAVAVDPSTGDVFVGDMPGGDDYHVVAYTSAGVQYDDFAADLIPDASAGGYGALSASQLAVNATTHDLYVGAVEKFYVFEKTTIDTPSATAAPATAIGQLTATLNATVNANGHAVWDCEFEYTDEADFLANGFAGASVAECPQEPDGTTETPLAVDVTGLSPGTGYRYRVSATSHAGTTESGPQSFETLPAVAPGVTTGSLQDVTETAATLSGTVNPHGGQVSDCHFELGTGTAYGTSLSCQSLPGPATSGVSVSKVVSGLDPGTSYHYRLVVTTNAGTTLGSDIEFATASPPPEPEPVPAPVPPAPLVVLPPPSSPVVVQRPTRCKKGFRRQRVRGKARCMKVCKRRFRKKRIRGKVRCVKVKRARKHRRRSARR